jgi:hypothetical protein
VANANTPDKLSPIHKHMAVLTAAGFGTSEVARITGYSVNAVSSIKGHPDFGRFVDMMCTDLARKVTDDVAARIRAASGEALDVNLHIMRHSKNERLRQVSAFDILDRAGFKPREVHITSSVQLPASDANLIAETLGQLGREIPHRPPVDNAVSILSRASHASKDEIEDVRPIEKTTEPAGGKNPESSDGRGAADIIARINARVKEGDNANVGRTNEVGRSEGLSGSTLDPPGEARGQRNTPAA